MTEKMTAPPASAGREEERWGEYLDVELLCPKCREPNTVREIRAAHACKKCGHPSGQRPTPAKLESRIAQLESELSASRSESSRLREAVGLLTCDETGDDEVDYPAMLREEAAILDRIPAATNAGEFRRLADTIEKLIATAALSPQPKEGA